MAACLLCAVVAVGVDPGSARADTIRANSEIFNPNQTGPTFGSPTTLPMIAVSVSYDDDAGTLTISESGGAPSYNTGWADLGEIQLSGPEGAPTVNISGQWTPANPIDDPPTLSDSAVNGTLDGTLSESSDQTTLTATWSDPALAGQNLTYVDIEGAPGGDDNSCFCAIDPAGAFYFSGYAPTVAVRNPGPRSSHVGTSIRGVGLSVIERGLSTEDPSNVAINTNSQPGGLTGVQGLPPGLRVSETVNGGPAIVGTPRKPGTYPVTITGTGEYDNGAQSVTGSAQFTWQIIPKPVPLKPTSALASQAFRAFVPALAAVPQHGPICPEIYNGAGTYSVCFVQYRLRGRWHLIGGEVRFTKFGANATVASRLSWRRRWVKCKLGAWNRRTARTAAVIPGTLSSNNACGIGAPQSDLYDVGIELDPAYLIKHPHNRRTAGWQFTESGGFNALGTYDCRRRHIVYSCANSVGDSFRYRP